VHPDHFSQIFPCDNVKNGQKASVVLEGEAVGF
jgi:hypothetical protein